MTDPFTVRDGLDRGLTRGTLRGDAYRAPVRGTRVVATSADLDSDVVRAALLEVARDDHFLSHTTAARLHGIPLPPRLRHDPVHVASPTLGLRMRRPGVVGHRLKAEVVEVDGMPVESPIDTLIHLATMLSVAELVVAIDWLLQPRNGIGASKADILHRTTSFRGARGLGRLRAALAVARTGSESPKESELRLLVRARLPGASPQRQRARCVGALRRPSGHRMARPTDPLGARRRAP